MKTFVNFLLVIFVLSAFVGQSAACTCTDYGVPVCKLYQDADAVFVGKVERIVSAASDNNANVSLSGINSISSFSANLVSVHFKIEKGFKGVQGSIVKALTYKGTSCDLQIKKGERWIIYAYKDEKTGNLSFGACGGNGEVEKDSDEIKELEMIARKKSEMSVVGRVSKERYDEVKDAKIYLIGNNLTLSTQSDEFGRYKFTVPQAGIYKIRVVVPFSATLSRYLNSRDIKESPFETETLFEYDAKVELNSCDYENLDTFKIDLKATGEINWRFSDASGKTLKDVDVQLCSLKSTEAETLKSCNYYDINNPDGTFSFGGLREGKFVLVVSKYDFPEFHSPYLRYYFPGIKNFNEAQEINLEQGQKLSLNDFKLPPPMETQEVTGRLFWRDGVPLTQADLNEDGVYFEFYNPQRDSSPLLMSHFVDPGKTNEDGLKLNENGSFSFCAFTGMKYLINFSANDKRGVKYSKQTEIVINENLKPLEIVLEKTKKQ